MKYISFRDTCVVTRRTGKDEWDNDISELVYSGECLYQEGGMSYTDKVGTKAPTVFLPQTKRLIALNDNIEVTTEFGRIIKASVLNARDIHLAEIVGDKLTRLELQQATEQQNG